jgi:hypothetical protein
MTNNDEQNTTQKTKHWEIFSLQKPGVNYVLRKSEQFQLHWWHPSYYCFNTRTSSDMEIVLDTSTHVIEDGSPHYGIPRTDGLYLASVSRD